MDLRSIVFDSIKNIEILKDVDNLFDLLKFNADVSNGDIALPCFALAKTLRQNPMVIADNVVANCTGDVFEKVENVNGYVNFFLNKKVVFNLVVDNIETKEKEKNGKTVFVDFSSLNLAKYMHIGHLSTTVIGSVISNIYEFLGYTVKRLNYVGDYGTPFGKMITAIKRWGNEDDIEKLGVDYVQGLYVKFNVECENDESLITDARNWSLKIENNESEAKRIYDKIISVSITEAKRLCDILQIYFDSWRGEAYYNDKMQPVIDELKEKGLLKTSEGAQIVDLEEHKLGACMIVKSDGGSLYATRDLATAIDRYDTYKFDLGIYVTSVQQNLHFARWFKVLELMGKDYAKNLKHVSYGTYSLPTGKIGSRFGKQALVKDMLDLSINKAREIITTRGTKTEDVEKLSKDIGIGAIKFGVLKTERLKDCVFDLEASLNFDGETSPYIQYTYARCNSIVNKCKGMDVFGKEDDIDNIDTFEIVKHLNSFEKTIIDSATDYEPCYISRYLLNLCSLFNKFYNNYRIIDENRVNNYRLRLVEKVKEVLKTGLNLLGINAPEMM
ncbi:MAG: arginine--tRNA ligase [Clostridiales bacterium]|nr:arginine--tRNA ligase [Clostridiales bacterium]